MIIFPSGISITTTEHRALLHIEKDPELWLVEALTEKARLRRDALINEWRPRLFADPDVDELPADVDALVEFIVARPGYRSRHAKELERQANGEANVLDGGYGRRVGKVAPGTTYNQARFEVRVVPPPDSVRLFPAGIDLPDSERDCILAYVNSIEDWVYGALLGHMNRGTKKMIRQYEGVLLADPEVTTIPANEEGMIAAITGHKDYMTLPEQIEADRV